MELTKFEIADYLDNNEVIAEYLNEVARESFKSHDSPLEIIKNIKKMINEL